MLSEQQHIDDFFRNKEEEWMPDTSQAEVHWQRLMPLLATPAVKPSGKKFHIQSSTKIIKLLGGFAVVTVLTLVTVTSTKNKKAPKPVAKTTTIQTPAKTTPPAAQKTTTPVVTIPPSATGNKTGIEPQKSSVAIKKQPIAAKSTENPVRNRKTLTHLPANTADEKPVVAKMLADFYRSIEKKGQEFYIQGNRDTLLRGKEGTKLFIPSYAFSNKAGAVKAGTIRIVLTEYYSYDDIVAAKLSTTSNGEQLVSGGMMNIKAQADGQELQLAPKKNLEVSIPAKNYDNRMQLFTGTTMQRTLVENNKDTPAYDISNTLNDNVINWNVADRNKSIINNKSKQNITVSDLSVDPHRVNYGKKITAKFFVADDFEMTDKEIKEKLRERYGNYYDRIKIRRVNKNKKSEVIDSVWMDYKKATRLKLITREDSISYAKQFKTVVATGNRTKDSAANDITAYEFSVPSLGWINCDRFLTDSRPKVDFTLDLGEGFDAGNFISQLVFVKYQSVLNCVYSGSKVQFRGIPENEPVFIVSVGVKEGKVISCIYTLKTTGTTVTRLTFEETTPEAFRKKLETLISFQ